MKVRKERTGGQGRKEGRKDESNERIKERIRDQRMEGPKEERTKGIKD
jgi:hypothetical protein